MRVFIRQNDMSIARELAQKKYVLMLNKIAIHGMNRLKMTEVFTELDLYGIYDEAYYQLSEGLRILVKPWKEPRDVFLETRPMSLWNIWAEKERRYQIVVR